MPPRPIVPTWSPQMTGGGRVPGFVLTRGIVGQMLDTLSNTNDDILAQAVQRQTHEQAVQRQAAGRAAGLQAAAGGAALPASNPGSFEFLFGKAPQDAAFDAGAKTGYLAGLSNQVKQGLAASADAAGNDPEKFAAGVDALRGRFAALPPELRADVDLDIEQGAVAYAQGIRKQNAMAAREQATFEIRDAMNTLGIEAQNASRAGDLQVSQAARGRWQVMAEAAIKDGALTGEWVADQARRLDGEIMEHAVLGRFWDAADRDGTLAARRYQIDVRQQAGKLGLTPDQADRLDATMDRELRARQIETERAERQADKARAASQESAFKQVIDLREAGQLTPEALRRLRPGLSDSQYKQSFEMLRRDEDGDAARVDPLTYSDLRARQARGEDVLPDAQQAYIEKRLDRSALEKIVSERDQALGEDVRAARSYIRDTVKGGDFFADKDASQRHAQAEADFDDWLARERAAGREPSRADKQRQARYVAASYKPTGTKAVAERPAFAVTRDGQTDWAETLRATEEAKARGDLGDEQLLREKRKIAAGAAAARAAAEAANEAAASAPKSEGRR